MVRLVVQALTLLGLSVAVHSFILSYGTAQQCGVVEIAWTRTKISAPSGKLAFPFYLHILPFNSTALVQRLDGWNASMGSGSLAVNFDLASNTPFLLGVTDANGTGVGHTSDNRTAMPSSDKSCLSTSAPTPGLFELTTTPSPSDCPSITVKLNTTFSTNPPAVIAFSPGHVPINLADRFSAGSNGSLTAGSAFTSLSRVLVLYDNGKLPPQTSELLKIGGTDSNSCLGATLPTVGNSTTTVSASTGAVMGYIMVSVVITVIIVILIVRYMKKRLRVLPVRPPSLPTPSEPPEPWTSMPEEKEEMPPVDVPTLAKANHSSSPPSQRTSETSIDYDVKPTYAQRLRHTIGVIVAPKATPPTRPSSSLPALSLSVSSLPPLPDSPVSARRRSAAALSSRRPSTTNETDESYFTLMAGASTPIPLPPFEYFDIRPDSPTIPESLIYPKMPMTPHTPNSAGARPKSQRSEKRSQFLKLNASTDALPSENSRLSPSLSTRTSGRVSWIKKRS